MAKIKNTKTELKAQKDALKRYQRFLPMLQLKKQQLQVEISTIATAIDDLDAKTDAWRKTLDSWIGLFSTDDLPKDLVVLKATKTDTGNIAGVTIPLYVGIDTERKELDLLSTPSWLDDAADALHKAMEFRAERGILEEQRRLITDELHTTSQRVNLFEKVKIPECKENIRVITIHIGDESTAAVARGKIAKKRNVAINSVKEEA